MKQVFAALVMLASLTSPAAAGLTDLTVEPAAPVVGDATVVSVSGWLPDPCWALGDEQVKLIERTLVLELWSAYVAPPDVGCIAVIVPFESVARHVFTEPGVWTIRVIEHARGPVGPLPDIVLEKTVTVTGSAPIEQLTWSTLKANFR